MIISEPKGVDFVVKSRSLTKKEEELLGEFIRENKAKRLKKLVAKKSSVQATLKKKIKLH